MEHLNGLRRVGRMTLNEIGDAMEAAEKVSQELTDDPRCGLIATTGSRRAEQAGFSPFRREAHR